MVVRRINKRGNYYYYNKRTKKITCERCWKISLAARRKKQKKKKKKKGPELPHTEQYFNQAIITAIKRYLLVLDYDIYISSEGEKKRLFKKAAENFKYLIEDILEKYYDIVEFKKIPSPHAVFSLMHWRKKKEIEVMLDASEFVGVKRTEIDTHKYFKKNI